MLAVRLFLSSAGQPIEHLRKWSVAVCLLFGVLTFLTMLLLKWHSIDMHVKLVSCFALCWKLPLWTISLELDTQSDRFGIMWHSTMILRILLCGWSNEETLDTLEVKEPSTQPVPPHQLRSPCNTLLPPSPSFCNVSRLEIECVQAEHDNIETSIHQKIVRHIAFVTMSSKAVHPKFVQLLPDFELLYWVFTCFYFRKGVVFVLILYSCQILLLNGATQDQELPSEPSKFWTFLHSWTRVNRKKAARGTAWQNSGKTRRLAWRSQLKSKLRKQLRIYTLQQTLAFTQLPLDRLHIHHIQLAQSK